MINIDLLIQDDDLVLSSIGEPALTKDADCIAQDLRHMIREKGYAVQLVAERNPVTIAATKKRIELEMEEDRRIYPGTARVELINESLICTAKTLDGDSINAEITG